MSHYTVLVINSEGHDDFEQQLEPFYEGIEVDEYQSGAITEDDWQRMRDFYAKEDETVKDMTNDELYEKYGDGWSGMAWRKNEEGEWFEYSTYNPKSKWDWFVMGGRWRGMLKLKDGKEGVLGESGVFKNEPVLPNGVDQAHLGDIDWEGMIDLDKYNEYKRFWELYIEGAEPQNEKEKKMIEHTWMKASYYLDKYGNKETYAKAQTTFSTYAVLKDGEWFEPGEMGWFGVSSAENKDELDFELNFHEKFLKDLPDNALLTVVDCHI